MQLERYSQEQIDVQCIVVSHERTSRCSTRNRVQRGAFDFAELSVAQSLANGGDDRGPVEKPGNDSLGIRHVQVAQSLPQLGIIQTMMLFGRWLDRLTLKVQVFDKDRDFTGVRATKSTINADQISEVETVGQLPVLFADLFLADEQTESARFDHGYQ